MAKRRKKKSHKHARSDSESSDSDRSKSPQKRVAGKKPNDHCWKCSKEYNFVVAHTNKKCSKTKGDKGKTQKDTRSKQRGRTRDRREPRKSKRNNRRRRNRSVSSDSSDSDSSSSSESDIEWPDNLNSHQKGKIKKLIREANKVKKRKTRDHLLQFAEQKAFVYAKTNKKKEEEIEEEKTIKMAQVLKSVINATVSPPITANKVPRVQVEVEEQSDDDADDEMNDPKPQQKKQKKSAKKRCDMDKPRSGKKRTRSKSAPPNKIDLSKEKATEERKAQKEAARLLALRTQAAKDASNQTFIRETLLKQFRIKNRTYFTSLCTKAGGRIAILTLRKELDKHKVAHDAKAVADTEAAQPAMIKLLAKLADKVSKAEVKEALAKK